MWNLQPPLSSERFLLPGHLSQVCRGWSTVASDSPALWSTLVFRIDTPFAKEEVENRLKKVKNCFLDCHFPALNWARKSEDAETSKTLGRILGTLTPFKDRVYRLSASVRQPFASRIFILLVTGGDSGDQNQTFPPSSNPPSCNLRELSFLQDLDPTIEVLSIEVPLLKDVALRWLPRFTFASNPVHGCGVITKLLLGPSMWNHSQVASFISLLKHNPGLETLSLTSVYAYVDHLMPKHTLYSG